MRRCCETLHREAVSMVKLDNGLTEIKFLEDWPEY